MASQTREELWRIELLGGLRAAQGERVVTRFRHQKAAVLLAYLAFSESGGRQRAHSREELVELLWPEIDPELGRGKLRFMLHSLRQQLEPPDVPTAPRLLIAERSTLRLDLAAFTTDVAGFQAAVQAAPAGRSAPPAPSVLPVSVPPARETSLRVGEPASPCSRT
jgi:DNA-binding SARP family transcriptional activator